MRIAYLPTTVYNIPSQSEFSIDYEPGYSPYPYKESTEYVKYECRSCGNEFDEDDLLNMEMDFD